MTGAARGVTMEALVYRRPRDFEVVELPRPEPQGTQVLVRQRLTGICGSDLHVHEGGFVSAYPVVTGHEIVGVVEEVGPDVVGLEPGQRVAVDKTSPCGRCWFCRRGEPLFCTRPPEGPGGFAEYVLADLAQCFVVDDLDDAQAVMVEPTACAVHGVDVLSVEFGADVLVFGAGPSGLLLAQLLRSDGAARVTVVSSREHKLERARQYGIDETYRIDWGRLPEAGVEELLARTVHGYDAVVDATGSPAVIAAGVSLLRRGGTLLVYGVAEQDATIPLRPWEVFARQLSIKGSLAQTHTFPRAIDAIRQGRVRVDGMITHELPLREFGAALEASRSDPECLKAAIRT